jgi:limonene 1,2-monooxygenase
MGFPRPFEGDKADVAKGFDERHVWCIGTPDDLVDAIQRLDESSGGFGGLLVQSVDWATREAVMHSWELIARYVKPRFQGSLVSLEASQQDAERTAQKVRELRDGATSRARESYERSKARTKA